MAGLEDVVCDYLVEDADCFGEGRVVWEGGGGDAVAECCEERGEF